MSQYSAFEMWTAVSLAYQSENEPIIHREKDGENGFVERATLTAGMPADLIASSSSNAHVTELVNSRDIGHPNEVFVHAGDLASLTGCSLETGRNWLQKFHDYGIVHHHGDITTTIDDDSRTVQLYFPVRDEPTQVMQTLYDLENRDTPDSLEDYKQVTAGQFTHLDESQFVWDENATVTVDVAQPEDRQISLQDYVKEQLHPDGLTPSSPKNFVYKLRKRAGLI